MDEYFAAIELYKISHETSQALMDAVDLVTGELDEEKLAKTLGPLNDERAEIVLDIVCVNKSLLAEADAYKAEADKLSARASQLKKRADRLKSFVKSAIPEGLKFQRVGAAVNWRKSRRVIFDGNPDELLHKFRKSSPRLREIGQALDGGVAVPGAIWDESPSMSFG